MRLSPSPDEVLHKRLAVIKSLLGPGWLGVARSEPGAAAPAAANSSWQAWRDAEDAYDGVLSWLLPGLTSLERAFGVSPGTDQVVAFDHTVGPREIPAAVLQILRQGMVVRPAGVATYCDITSYDLLQCVVPLLADLYCLHDRRLALPLDDRPARCLAVLAGMPGAGKSVLAAVLEVFAGLLTPFPRIQAIGMDGWHYPGPMLRAKRFKDEAGRDVCLATRKGSPESFDTNGLTVALRRLRAGAAPCRCRSTIGGCMSRWPDALVVDAPIVLIEGNYLLIGGQGWESVGRMMDMGIWLEMPLDVAKESILFRHRHLGRDDQQTLGRWTANDWPNSLQALRGRPNSDAVISGDDWRRLRYVRRL